MTKEIAIWKTALANINEPQLKWSNPALLKSFLLFYPEVVQFLSNNGIVLFHRVSPFEHSEWDLLTTVRKKKKVLMFFNAARPAKTSQLRKMDSLPSCSSSIELFKMAMKKCLVDIGHYMWKFPGLNCAKEAGFCACK